MKIDLAKRKMVMERSMKLGHCICDPRRPCPCEVFRDQGICPCAGERPEPSDVGEIRLTRLVRNAGCASKISPADLESVLGRLPPVNDPAVVSGLAAADDAAIYRITHDLALVQTVDVFTPCVDDPYTFGRICAANCLSDIYAMGGTPRTALSVLAFPSETLPGELMYQMLAGAMETLGEAGVALVGGHSIKDDEIKLGFAITGTIDLKAAASLEQAREGDLLVLTKPLGTGVVSFCAQLDRADPEALSAAARSMVQTNRAAAEAMQAAGASACTDVTGFGLLGHLLRFARQSRLSATVFAGDLPALPGALEALREEVIPGGIERNREFVAGALAVEPGVEPALVHLACDPQTSGGLLIAIPASKYPGLLDELRRSGVEGTLVGRFTPGEDSRLTMAAGSDSSHPAAAGPALSQNPNPAMINPPSSPEAPNHEPGCCSEFFGNPASAAASSVSETQRAFGQFMRLAQGKGVLDERAKELILFALVVQSRCKPCFKAHLERARELGITRAELDEAAWCAIAMGGAPVRMFYQEMTA